MPITPEEVAKLAAAATEGPLTQIEQLRLHIECDLSPPCLDSLLDEIDAMEAKLAKATDTLARIVRGDDDAHNWAIWTLAELTGKTDD